MAAGRSSAAAAEDAAVATPGRRGIDRQAVDRGFAYALMLAALALTYALH
ncbi:hypothetical protein ACP70R_028705 [Stipagrostis hirtigluma subsp. patula]